MRQSGSYSIYLRAAPTAKVRLCYGECLPTLEWPPYTGTLLPQVEGIHPRGFGGGDKITFGAKPIAELSLPVCFKRTPAGLELRNAFDAGLKTVDGAKLTRDAL